MPPDPSGKSLNSLFYTAGFSRLFYAEGFPVDKGGTLAL
jgi:hypothetical protein